MDILNWMLDWADVGFCVAHAGRFGVWAHRWYRAYQKREAEAKAQEQAKAREARMVIFLYDKHYGNKKSYSDNNYLYYKGKHKYKKVWLLRTD